MKPSTVRSLSIILALLFLLSIGILYAESVKRNLPKELPAFYTYWFQSPYEYMFEETGDSGVFMNNRYYGTFTAGIQGMLLYGGIVQCAAEYLGIGVENRDFYDLSPIEQLSGLEIYIKEAENEREFSYYNPRIIEWGYQNLIPDPSGTVMDHKFEEIYTKIFRRFFRMMTESYLYLKDKGIYEKEKQNYLGAMKDKNFEAVDYLTNRFGSSLPEYRIEDNSTNFLPEQAIGFWLRRGIDKTDKELMVGLWKLMKLYDNEWFFSMKGKYKKAGKLLR